MIFQIRSGRDEVGGSGLDDAGSGAGDRGHGVAGVDDESGVAGEEGVVDVGVVGDDEGGVEGGHGFGGEGDGAEVEAVLAHLGEAGDVGVVVGDLGAALVEEADDLGGGGFADVVDVGLIGDAEDEDAGVFEGLGVEVEGVGDLIDDVAGHGAVDFAGEFDEAGGEAELFGFEGEVEGVDGDAVPAEAWAWEEGVEAEGLGGGGADDAPDVDVHGGEEGLEFVDEGDVDGAVDVFEEFGGLGDLGGVDGDDVVDGGGVEGVGGAGAGIVEAADEARDGLGVEALSTGVFAFGGEGEEEIGGEGSWARALGKEDGEADFAGGAGVGGGFEDDEGAGLEDAGDHAGGVLDEGEVGLLVLAEGGGDADADGVAGGEVGGVGGWGEARGAGEGLEEVVAEVLEVGAALFEEGDFFVVDVEGDDAEGGVVEGADEGEADVAEADDADDGFAALDAAEESGEGAVHARGD